MPVTYKLISTVTVSTATTANIDFQNIPATYDDLVLLTSLRYAGNVWDGWYFYFNNANSNLSSRYVLGNGAAASSGALTDGYGGSIGGTNITASTFGNTSIYIPNYSGSTNKSYSSDAAAENNATTAYVNLIAGLWSQTTAINRLTIVAAGNQSLVQHSSASLYGIKKS